MKKDERNDVIFQAWSKSLYISPAVSKDLYQVQETLKKLCEFSSVWADRADLGSTETAEQKLNYATFEGGFFSFSGSKFFF